MKRYALIVAGGSGTRMGADVPKQFLPVAGQPILMHTINAFYHFDHLLEIIVVLPVSHFSKWTALSLEYDFDVPHRLVAGGSTRFHSVKNGLNTIEGDGVVAIHDGVRPLVDITIIEESFKRAREDGNAVAAVSLKDSIRKLSDGQTKAVERKDYKAIQTPQTFDLGLIKKAYEIDYVESITDDASVAELAGHQINLIQGSYKNIKITTTEDLIVAEAFMA